MTRGPFKVVIPARYASSRLPGKPLVELAGRTMIERVVDQARHAGAQEVVVASDDQRVLDAAERGGCRVCLTRADHPSGSDRVMEVAQRFGWSAGTVLVNVQGDEPLIPPAVIAQVAALLDDHPDVGVATLCEPIDDLTQVFDPNVVKVVAGGDGFARYFSRAPIPYARDAFAATSERSGPVPEDRWRRHIGIYGYRLAALERFVTMPVGTLERLESLEQLRMVEQGMGIRIAEAVAPVPGGVDTEADVDRVRRLLHGQS